MKAFLILADGTVYEGESIGSTREVISEIVFNTSMTGYLEILTDPSYCGQSVVMTYPLIGNYGVCYEDMEDPESYVDGYIVREISNSPSNFRSEDKLEKFLVDHDIAGIQGIDTRALTKRLRNYGTMNGMITTNENFVLEEVLPKIKAYKVTDAVKRVSCKEKTVLPGDGMKVALMDFGAKKNIAKSLNERGCEVTIYPAYTSAEEIIASNPDGIMLSNGPGDPAENVFCIEQIKKLIGKKPLFGICLGHQLTALAMGGKTVKLKYGHHGANQPVKELFGSRTYITSQNHGYAVDFKSLENKGREIFINANDGSCEGIEYPEYNAFTVQFHPEACSGPHDTELLFDRFIGMMEEDKNA